MSKISIDFKTGTLKSKPEYIVGIDLGTTNSLIASVIDGKPTVLPIGANSSTLIPSVLHFKDDNTLLIGEEGKAAMVKNPENTLYSFKRLMGKTFRDVHQLNNYKAYSIAEGPDEELVNFKIKETRYNAIELSTILLKNLKERAETYFNSEITKAVITVPAYFTDAQRQATRQAGIQAGFDVLRIINEPTAASMAYGIGLKKEEVKQVMIYDFGGGTFDVSILRIENGIFEVLSTQGDNFLGGDDIDQLIVQYWISKYQIEASTKDLKELKILAEFSKKNLLNQNTVHVYFNNTKFELNLVELENISKDIINKTLECCQKALKDSALSTKDIDEIILVGGSSRLSIVKNALQRTFMKPLNDFLNPDEVVALGAAIQADILAGNRKDLLLLDITPLSLGIETIGGLMDTIVPRNSKIPLRLARNYTTSKDGQTKLKISVFQGEREMVEDNIKLAEFILNNLPPMAAGLAKIEVQFNIDADGILSVTAKELRSGAQQSIEIRSVHQFDETQIGKHLKESIVFAEEDKLKKSLIEAINEAKYILDNSKKFIRQNNNLLSADELNLLSSEMSNLEAAIQNNEQDSIHKAITQFNSATSAMAQRIMEIQFNKSLGGSSIDNI